MRTIFITICLLSVITSCVPQTKKNSAKSENKTAAVNSETKAENIFVIDENIAPGKAPFATKNIGTINEGEVIEMGFVIKNERKLPLIIFNATASCGCTSVSYNKEPIKSGDTKKIDVKYDSKGKSGQQMIFINLITDSGDYTIKLNLFVKK